MKFICKNCKTEFSNSYKNRKFCSRKCMAESHKTEMKCLRCGKIFNVENYELKKRNVQYCSMKCYKGEGTRIKVKCSYCSREIERLKSHINSDIIFCNKKCKGEWQRTNLIGGNNPGWKGGWKKYYGSNWNKQKDLTRKRDDFACQICKIKEDKKAHDVHHKIPFRIYGIERYKEANDLENLITLCNSCHSKIKGESNEM